MIRKYKLLIQLKRFLLFYLVSFVVICIALLIFLLIRVDQKTDIPEFFIQIVTYGITTPWLWVSALFLYFIFRIIKSCIQDYRKNHLKGFIKGILFKIILPTLGFIILKSSLAYYRTSDSFDYTWDYSVENNTVYTASKALKNPKQKGIHVFNIGNDLSDIEQLKTNNFDWITLTPFIGMEFYNEPFLRTFDEGRVQKIQQQYADIKKKCDFNGIKIMLKPHIWLYGDNNGKWRSDIEMQNEGAWTKWFDSYSKSMLQYAKIAADLKFEQLCIGTELETTVLKKPEQWKSLIQKVKSVYKGKITYAANWNQEYKEIPFWDQLDYIGIQAYFPLQTTTELTLEDLESSWNKFIPELENISKTYNKPILFTEIGYKSIKGTAIKPWEWQKANDYFAKIASKEQYLCYQSFFNTLWKKEWFRGIHIWEWQTNDDTSGENTGFTIEGKPALNLIAKEFKKAS